MDDFARTRRGAKFFDADVPRIAAALEKIAERLPKPPAPPTERDTDRILDVLGELRASGLVLCEQPGSPYARQLFTNAMDTARRVLKTNGREV